MKTDELIVLLSTNADPVDTHKVVRRIRDAILLGTGTALLMAIAALGLRMGLHEPSALAFFFGKLAFGLAVMALATMCLVKYVRPGGESRSRFSLTALPFLAVIALAVINLMFAPRSHWEHMMLGDRWLECLVSIPAIAIVPFVTIMWAIRFAAPTNLRHTGALAGLIAGGVSATAYALHCTDDSFQFVALWYGGTVILCGVAGAALGPRLLRW